MNSENNSEELRYVIVSSLLKINLLFRRSYSSESSTVSSSGDSSNKLDLYCLMLSLSLCATSDPPPTFACSTRPPILFQALSLLPLEHLDEAFDGIKSDLAAMNSEQVVEFIDYVDHTWTGSTPLFSRQMVCICACSTRPSICIISY